LKDVFNYYEDKDDLVIFEIEALGMIVDSSDKSLTDKIRIIRVIPREEWEKELGIIKEYDQNGNPIYSRDSSGNEEWKEYDQNGNMIHSRDSSGIESWYEYDQNGNQISCRNSYAQWSIVKG